MFRFLDIISIFVAGYVYSNNELCQKPFMTFYYANAAWSLLSLVVLTWYTQTQLQRGYQTTRGELLTYGLEFGYLCLTALAWHELMQTSFKDYCEKDPSGKYNEFNYTELINDMIILNYMRSIRLLSFVTFAVLCSPLMLCCYCINKPKPPVNVKE